MLPIISWADVGHIRLPPDQVLGRAEVTELQDPGLGVQQKVLYIGMSFENRISFARIRFKERIRLLVNIRFLVRIWFLMRIGFLLRIGFLYWIGTLYSIGFLMRFGFLLKWIFCENRISRQNQISCQNRIFLESWNFRKNRISHKNRIPLVAIPGVWCPCGRCRLNGYKPGTCRGGFFLGGRTETEVTK